MASDFSLHLRFSSLHTFLPRLLAPERAPAAPCGSPYGDGKFFRHALHLRRRSCGRRRFVSKSFLQDLLIELSHTVTDERIREEREVLEKNHSLGTSTELIRKDEDSSVLDGDKGLKGALFSLQVQSLHEQEVIAATPVHSEGLYALYASVFAGNIVEQIWHFAWPSAVALLHDSLLPVAVVSFVSKLVIFVGGPWVGAQMDSLPRVFAFNALSAIQTVAQVVSAGAIIYALNKAASSASSTCALLLQPWFLILVLTSAIERLTGLASGVAFERDWVILLAGANRPIALADANAMLCRVDLLCEIAGTSIFGFLLSKYDPVTCLVVAAGVMIFSLPALIFLVYCTNKLSKGVLDRPKVFNMHELKINQTFSGEKSSASREGDRFHMFKLGWAQYLAQPALPASLAAVFLFFNIGLAPGSLMTSFLTQRGLNPSIIGAFSGMGALMGFGATFLSTALVRKFGLYRAGAAGLVLQASLLAVAVVAYWSNSLTHPKSLTFFLILIVLSRLGHFTYDMVGGQILQTAVHPSQANIVGTTEISLASLAELLMLGVAIVANDVSHFGSLAALSMAAVIGAATVYCWWMSNIPKELTTPPFGFTSKSSSSSWELDLENENLCSCNI